MRPRTSARLLVFAIARTTFSTLLATCQPSDSRMSSTPSPLTHAASRDSPRPLGSVRPLALAETIAALVKSLDLAPASFYGCSSDDVAAFSLAADRPEIVRNFRRWNNACFGASAVWTMPESCKLQGHVPQPNESRPGGVGWPRRGVRPAPGERYVTWIRVPERRMTML